MKKIVFYLLIISSTSIFCSYAPGSPEAIRAQQEAIHAQALESMAERQAQQQRQAQAFAASQARMQAEQQRWREQAQSNLRK